ncbi:unnamed protein product [Meganyctiphanes norvegica]|uniref:Uncharacterized protein n=1 Tax=Meganyctiphanes norvegica TaxID=48144 RepID=A0AAV2Q020_MEGNR
MVSVCRCGRVMTWFVRCLALGDLVTDRNLPPGGHGRPVRLGLVCGTEPYGGDNGWEYSGVYALDCELVTCGLTLVDHLGQRHRVPVREGLQLQGRVTFMDDFLSC